MTPNTSPLRCVCGNCDWQGPEGHLGLQLHEIRHLSERLDPGGVVPAGECPECGALAYPVVPEPAPATAARPGAVALPIELPAAAPWF